MKFDETNKVIIETLNQPEAKVENDKMIEESRTETWWECYVEGTDGGKHYRHWTLQSAQTEAERLARLTDKTVYVVKCVGKCKSDIKWESPYTMVVSDVRKRVEDGKECPYIVLGDAADKNAKKIMREMIRLYEKSRS